MSDTKDWNAKIGELNKETRESSSVIFKGTINEYFDQFIQKDEEEPTNEGD